MKSENGDQVNAKGINLYQQALTAFIQEDLMGEQLQAACNIMDQWNGPEGPNHDVQARNAQKYGLKYVQNFADKMWRYCSMRMVCLTGWKNENRIIQACCMDFNDDIGGGSSFHDIHTLEASWREYLSTAYENMDVPGAEEVQNITVKHPRAKWGDAVGLVTDKHSQTWIGNLKGHNHDSILQMVHGLAYHNYEGKVCGRCSAMVPFKKLGQYQEDLIAPRHLPENFTFTVDPSHMHLSTATELLNFWHEQQVSNPEDVFCFQKWLDQYNNLQPTSNGSTLLLQIARKRNQKLCNSPSPLDDETMVDEDGEEETDYEATHSLVAVPHAPHVLATVPSCWHKKTPVPSKRIRYPPTNDEDSNDRNTLPAVPSHLHKTPVPCKRLRCPTTDDKDSKGGNSTEDDDLMADLPAITDDDGFESVPFVDDSTPHPGPPR
ncbi:hypothetical protein EV401DRAFT_2078742 [Pisolithus croceorrhizus]|nr:hypothetical protein EV401DRAFT_2078742 [Pisolithus croceorrhizus]